MTEQQPPQRSAPAAGERAAISLSLLATVLSTFAVIGISFVLLDLREPLGITTPQVNLLRCTAISSGLLIVFCAGSLSRRFGEKRTLAGSLGLWIAGSLLLASHADLLTVALGLVLMGCADAGVRVSSYAMLCGGARDARQISMLVSANTLANSLAFVGSPVLNSWILVHLNNGAAVVALLWTALFTLALILVLLFAPRRRIADASPAEQGQPIPWTLLLAAGACAALLSTLPILRAFQPAWGPAALTLTGACSLATALSWRRHRTLGEGFAFLGQRRLLLLLLALASLFSIDYRYCAERFLAIRYQLDLAVIAAWLTPTSLAGIAAALVCAPLLPRLGITRTIAIGLLGCLILPISFLTADAQVPIPLIAASTASFAFGLTLVRVGLTSKVTALTARPLLANLEAVRHVLATSAWSLGSALAVEVLIGGFRRALEQQLRPLSLPEALLSTISRLVASGQGRQVLQNGYGVPREELMRYLGKDAAPTITAIMSVLHGMGWLILAMLTLVTLLIVLSRRVAATAQHP